MGTKFERSTLNRYERTLTRTLHSKSLTVISYVSTLASGLNKFQHVGIELFLTRVIQAVRSTGIDLLDWMLDRLRSQESRSIYRYNLIVIAMNNQRQHIELLQLLSEICFRKCVDAIIGVSTSNQHALPPPWIDLPLVDFGTRSVEPTEWTTCHSQEELRSLPWLWSLKTIDAGVKSSPALQMFLLNSRLPQWLNAIDLCCELSWGCEAQYLLNCQVSCFNLSYCLVTRFNKFSHVFIFRIFSLLNDTGLLLSDSLRELSRCYQAFGIHYPLHDSHPLH